MELELIAVVFVGLILGSFLNAVIYRVPRDLSLLNPLRSICPSCNAPLKWYDNIPLLSWLFLRARCRSCNKPISGQYPFVEFLGGAAALASYLQFDLTPVGFVIFALLLALIAITFIDFEFRIIPDVISLPGMILGFCIAIAAVYTSWFHCPSLAPSCPITKGPVDSLVGFLFGGGFFYIIGTVYEWVTKREGIGFGDVKLMGMTGALLGWRSVAPTIFVGSLVGAAIGIGVMIVCGTGRKTEIAFGPWLAVGTVIYIFGDLPIFRF